MGTLLLGFAFQCLAVLSMFSGGIIEHPKNPDEIVSIWRLPLLRMILALPNMRLVHLAQGLSGAPSAKPTTLLVLGMPDLERELAQRMASHLPTGESIGTLRWTLSHQGVPAIDV